MRLNRGPAPYALTLSLDCATVEAQLEAVSPASPGIDNFRALCDNAKHRRRKLVRVVSR